jgi:hypothetical protein
LFSNAGLLLNISARYIAAASPDGPPPIISTSVLIVFVITEKLKSHKVTYSNVSFNVSSIFDSYS